jgi:PHD/YefM family antitoxin component YafN of YafNO toxin-antitoxin module
MLKYVNMLANLLHFGLKKDNFVSIRELQKSPGKVLKSGGYKIILQNSKPIGMFISWEDWEELEEQLKLLENKEYLKEIEESRKAQPIPAEEVWKEAGLI